MEIKVQHKKNQREFYIRHCFVNSIDCQSRAGDLHIKIGFAHANSLTIPYHATDMDSITSLRNFLFSHRDPNCLVWEGEFGGYEVKFTREPS